MAQEVALKISALPEMVAALATADYFPVVTSGVTSRAQLSTVLGQFVPRLETGATSGAANVAAINAAIVSASAATSVGSGPAEVRLPAGEFYVSGSINGQNNVTLCGAGIGKTSFYMPASSYPNTVYQQKDSTSVLVSVLGELSGGFAPLVNFEMRGFSIESEVADGRYTYPIVARNVQNLRIRDVEVTGISIGNCITLDTVLGGEVSGCRLHDCTTATAGAIQLSGIEVDANRVNSTNSTALDIHDNWIEDLTMTGAALPTPNMQTDGINLGVGNNHGHTVHANHIRNVGEGIDCFSSECTIYGNHLDDCANGALKFIHGASRNNAFGNSIMRPGFAGIYLGGSNTAIVADNYIHDNTIESVNQAGLYPLGYGIKLDVNGGPTYLPARNTVARNKFTGGVSNLDIVIQQDDGTDNRFIDNEADGWAVAYANIGGGTATVVNAKKTLVRVGLNASEATASAVEKIVQFDTEEVDTQGEFDTATYTYTASSYRRLNVMATVRAASGAGEAWLLRIKKNGTLRAEQSQFSGGSPTQLTVSDSFTVAPGDTVAVFVFQNLGARDIGGSPIGSYLTIEEVAG